VIAPGVVDLQVNNFVSIVYKIAKDLAHQYLSSFVEEKSIKLAFYKACIDKDITYTTLSRTVPLLAKNGVLAVECHYHNLSDVVRFCEETGYAHDVLVFHGNLVHGQDFASCYSSVIFFVVLFNTKPEWQSKVENFEELGGELPPLEEIVNEFTLATDNGDTLLFIGDISFMALYAASEGREFVVFSDDPACITVLTSEGAEEKEIDVEEKRIAETVKTTATEVVAKPLNVEEYPDKVEASEEEKEKALEENVIGEHKGSGPIRDGDVPASSDDS